MKQLLEALTKQGRELSRKLDRIIELLQEMVERKG